MVSICTQPSWDLVLGHLCMEKVGLHLGLEVVGGARISEALGGQAPCG